MIRNLTLIYCVFLATSCGSLRRQPTKRDLKNLKSASTIEQKQEVIKRKSEEIQIKSKEIAKLTDETIVQSKKIQNRSIGGWQIPSWVYWAGGIGLLAYLGILPLVLGVGIRIIHKIAKGLKEVNY